MAAPGEPDLSFADLQLWVHGRQFPDAADYWDGNWLNVTAQVQTPGSQVRAGGPILHLGELARWLESTEELYLTLKGRADLACIEPNLRVELVAQIGGHIDVHIRITPDHMSETHTYKNAVDQTFLPALISASRRILELYPIKDVQGGRK